MKDRDEIIKDAHEYASKGQYKDAIAEYLKILPHSVDGNIRNVIGDLYLKNDSPDEAIKYFKEAAAIFNKDESHAKAIALYHKILSINPDLLDVVMDLAVLNAERGFITQAIEGMSRAAEVYYSKGLPMKALRVYKKALALCPSNISLKIQIAELHLVANRIDKAVTFYLKIAREYEAHAEFDKAIHMYKKVFKLDPDNIESLIHLSRLADDNQDLELALKYMSKAAAIAPNNNEIRIAYSSLAQKANKDTSESSQHINDGNEQKETQHIRIPDALNQHTKTDSTHEPLDLSPESSIADTLHSGKTESSSSFPLPVASTGNSYEDPGFTVPPVPGDTGTEKNGIWDTHSFENTSNPSVIDPTQGETSNVIPGHETAEAVYDQHYEKNNLTMPVKKSDHNRSIKDSQRLKRRVKTSRVHVLLIVIFTCITSISFFITYNFIKKSQIVDVETPVHVMSPEPYNQPNEDDIDILMNESTITDVDSAEDQLIEQPFSLPTGKYPEEINQDEVSLPYREADTLDVDSEGIQDNTIETAPEDEGNNFSNNTDDTIVSTREPDSDTMHAQEALRVLERGKLTVPVREADTHGIEIDGTTDTSIDTSLEEEGSNFSSNTDDTIVSTREPDSDAMHVKEALQVLERGKLTVPVREAGTSGIVIDGTTDTSIDTALEKEGKNYPNNTKDPVESTMKPAPEIEQENETSHIDTGILTVPENTDQVQLQEPQEEEEEEEEEEENTALISFNELFDNNNNNWDIVETSAAHVRLKNGKYYIRNRRSSGAYIILNGPYISTDFNFEIESHLDSVEPSGEHTYGLVFGAKNKEDFFVFQILPGNNYSIKKYFGGGALELAGGKINSRPGSKELYNVFKITCKDKKLSFFINGHFIDEVPDIYFSRRKTGLFIDSNAEIVVDKILLHQQP